MKDLPPRPLSLKPAESRRDEKMTSRRESTRINASDTLEDLIARYRDRVTVRSQEPAKQGSTTRKFIDSRISYSITEFAARTGLSPKTVERMIKRGEIRVRRVGRRIVIPTSAIEAWLNQME